MLCLFFEVFWRVVGYFEVTPNFDVTGMADQLSLPFSNPFSSCWQAGGSMASPFVPVDLDKLLDEFEEKEEGGC